MKHLRPWLAAALAAPLLAMAAPQARVIVAFKPGAAVLQGEARSLSADSAARWSARLQRRADALAAHAGRRLITGRRLTDRWQVLRAEGLDSEALAARLATHPDVAWAVPDRRRRALMLPNDPLYPNAARPFGPTAGQWYLQPSDAVIRSAVDAQTAWDLRPGAGAGQVIAIIDTGVRPEHPDLAGRLLPGIDTIDDLATANDGDGPDGDASDPGDWVTDAESRSGDLAGCGEASSSWHGTQVATIAGALTNDDNGMAGTAYGARILPVRVLGKCGGYDSDIVAGMLWAAGLEAVQVAGEPEPVKNLNPARVLNLSLGGIGACEAVYIDAVKRINAEGAVVVAAAGNSNGHAVGSPANCPGVIAVGGLRHAGAKVGFSDLGPEIAISAPGGNCVFDDPAEPCRYPILAGSNSGSRGPVASVWTDATNYSVGTSFSAPIVSGVAAMVLAGRPDLTPAELKTVLQVNARPFPQDGATNEPISSDPVPVCVAPSSVDQLQCYCSTALCGAGMLDAPGAVQASEAGFARIETLTATPTAGSAVTLDGSSSLAPLGRTVQGYAWTLVAGGGIASGFSSATDAATVTLTPTGAGSVTVRLTVTDDLGGTVVQQTAFSVAAAPVAPAPVPPPVPAPGSSGGGAMGGAWLLLLALATAALRINRRA